MITRIQIENYRSIEKVDVSLENLTVLVGRNGAGKSAFIDAIRFLLEAVRFGLDRAIDERGGIGRLRKWGAKGFTDIIITVWIGPNAKDQGIDGDSIWIYQIALKSLSENEWFVGSESCWINVKSIEDQPIYSVENGQWQNQLEKVSNFLKSDPEPNELVLSKVGLVDGRVALLEYYFRQIRCYSIFPLDSLRVPQNILNEPFLREDGKNMAQKLLELMPSSPSVQLELIPSPLSHYRMICSALKSILGDVDKYAIDKVSRYLVVKLRHISPDHPYYELSQESDGTLRVLALLTALFQANLPSLLAIEEPELHLHPGTFRALAEVIKEVSQKTQIILTTQSPDFITEFDPNNLRVVEKREGKTYIGGIENYQLDAINNELFTTGDLLRIEELKINGTPNDTNSSDDQTSPNR
ncbi:MAG: AAA family ATPase [Candidatus Kapaibacterium sp.]